MKKITAKIIILAIAGTVLVTGCEEENQISEKKGRLIAVENVQLKKELAQCREEIKRQEKLVEKCLQDKENLATTMQESIEKAKEDVLSDFEENVKLRQENEDLKAEIAKLKKKLKM